MPKCIIIPDVHGRRFWRGAVKGNEEEKIIFLGDYVDPYNCEGILPGEAYDGLIDILEFKKAHPDNVVLLLFPDPCLSYLKKALDRAAGAAGDPGQRQKLAAAAVQAV